MWFLYGWLIFMAVFAFVYGIVAACMVTDELVEVELIDPKNKKEV